MQKISQPHDKFIKEMLSNVELAHEFLYAHLPNELITQVDLSTLSLVKNEHINALNILKTDVVYAASFLNSEQKVYFLIEHLRNDHRFVALRLLEYTCKLMRHSVTDLNSVVLPIVVPLVLYNGKTKYTQPRFLFDLFGDKQNVAWQYLMRPFILIDVKQIPDNLLLKQGRLGAVEYVLKHVDDEDILDKFRKLSPELKKLAELGAEEVIISILHYVLHASDVSDLNQLLDIIKKEFSKNIGDKAMTIAEKLYQQGQKEGISQGKRMIACNLLKENISIDIVAKTTELSFSEIKQLQQSLVKI